MRGGFRTPKTPAQLERLRRRLEVMTERVDQMEVHGQFVPVRFLRMGYARGYDTWRIPNEESRKKRAMYQTKYDARLTLNSMTLAEVLSKPAKHVEERFKMTAWERDRLYRHQDRPQQSEEIIEFNARWRGFQAIEANRRVERCQCDDPPAVRPYFPPVSPGYWR